MNALISMLRRRLMTVWIGYALAFLFALAIPITNILTLQTAMGTMRFVAMDSRGTFYISHFGNFETAQKIRLETARDAVATIFTRNPDGYDFPERLERMFNPTTAAKLQADAARDSDTYRQQQIHSKVETGDIHEIQVSDNTALVSVECQILRTGVFNQKPITDTKRATVFLRMTVNDAISQNGRYPLVVTNYEEQWQ
jgi:hypothetical protein